jgi:hypothetical protein
MTDSFSTALERVAQRRMPRLLGDATAEVLEHIRRGCFQRSLSLIVAATSTASGLEVSYEHYKGSYSNPVMYTPVALSGALTVAAGLGVVNGWSARVIMRAISVVTLADGLVGFFFHIRGITRKPGGWTLPVTNIVMGPPIFAPLLFGTSAYLGLLASYLRREEEMGRPINSMLAIRSKVLYGRSGWRNDLHYGKFQKHLSAVTMLWALFSGFEALYSHYKTNFRYPAQWIPVLLTPVLMGAAMGAIKSRKIANTLLPAVSSIALANGAVGFYYHSRGIVRRSGGLKKPLYNILYGPPIFAPLLFAACGFLGLLSSLLRREG